MDSAQDVTAHDQCAIVVRYIIDDKAKESSVYLVNSDSSIHALLIKSLAVLDFRP